MEHRLPGLSNKLKNACFGQVFWKIYSIEVEAAARINSGKVKSFQLHVFVWLILCTFWRILDGDNQLIEILEYSL